MPLSAAAIRNADRILRRLERDIFPSIRGNPIAQATAPQLLGVTRPIEQPGAPEPANRGLSNCGQLFRYAVATRRAERDLPGDLRPRAAAQGQAR